MSPGASVPQAERQLVVIVDDDALVRGSIDTLFRSVGLETLVYSSAQDLLRDGLPDVNCCLVVDVRMPHVGGLEFQARLLERGEDAAIIFVTGHGDIPMTVQAMKAGAVDFLAKPFRDQDMLDAVTSALARDRLRREERREQSTSRALYSKLTPREREVMAGVVRGLLNKQIAGDLGLSEITIKLHRASLMKKLGIRSVIDLARISESLGQPTDPNGL